MTGLLRKQNGQAGHPAIETAFFSRSFRRSRDVAHGMSPLQKYVILLLFISDAAHRSVKGIS